MSQEGRSPTAENWWAPLWEFFIHVVVGTGLFLIISLPALALDWSVRWLSGRDFSPWIIAGMQVAEYSLFALDLLLFLVFLAKTVGRTIKRM